MSRWIRFLSELVEKEIQNGIQPDRMVIAGFSQGGAIALTMLRSTHKFAAILGPQCHSIDQQKCDWQA